MKSIVAQILPAISVILNAVPFAAVLAVILSELMKSESAHLPLSLVILFATSLNWMLLFQRFRPKDTILLKSVLFVAILGNIFLLCIGAVILHVAKNEGHLISGYWVLLTATISVGLTTKYWFTDKIAPATKSEALTIKTLRFDKAGKVVVEEGSLPVEPAQKEKLNIVEIRREQASKRRFAPKNSGLVAPAGSMFAILSAMQINSHIPLDRDWAVLEACGAILLVSFFLWKEIKRRYPRELVMRMRAGAILSCVLGLLIAPLLPVLLGYQYYRLYRALLASGDKITIAELRPIYLIAGIVILVASGLLILATIRLDMQGHV